MPALAEELKESISSSLIEILEAAKELSAAAPADVRNKCQAKKLKTATDCYKECGKEIKVTPELKKAWLKKSKAKSKAKGKASKE